MKLVFEILLCAFATFGVYALFFRLAVMLLRRDDCVLAIKAEGKTVEEVMLLAELAAMRAETEKGISCGAVILFDEEHESLEKALLTEGFLVYKRKT